ncbi:unnamed protein product [Strongylus vulgaris]|uniref:Uncharacterized protein n=1 Tax=Strongylus vulgaris TaxID=40348 RepID=A0A3P7K9R0_STRVU|nr:unnamed protein product [Strongylus vulgaris]
MTYGERDRVSKSIATCKTSTWKHREFVRGTDDYKVIEQVCRGVTESMKATSVSLNGVPNPITKREYQIYRKIVDQLEHVPIFSHFDEPCEEPSEKRISETVESLREDICALQEQIVARYAAPEIPRSRLYMTFCDALYLEWMLNVEKNLMLWRRVVTEDHPCWLTMMRTFRIRLYYLLPIKMIRKRDQDGLFRNLTYADLC